MNSDISAAITTILVGLIFSTYLLRHLLVKANKKSEVLENSIDSLKDHLDLKYSLLDNELKEIKRINSELIIKTTVLQLRNEERLLINKAVVPAEVILKKKPGPKVGSKKKRGPGRPPKDDQ